MLISSFLSVHVQAEIHDKSELYPFLRPGLKFIPADSGLESECEVAA